MICLIKFNISNISLDFVLCFHHQSAEVEKVELKVTFLEAKNAQFVQELMEQQKLITRMKRHIDEQEKLCAHQCRKVRSYSSDSIKTL